MTTYEEYCDKAIKAGKEELELTDPIVIKGVQYVRFVSKSKGIRNGKRRMRKKWQEVRLIKYRLGFQLWHRFAFDIYATEILGQAFDGEDLKQRLDGLWGY